PAAARPAVRLEGVGRQVAPVGVVADGERRGVLVLGRPHPLAPPRAAPPRPPPRPPPPRTARPAGGRGCRSPGRRKTAPPRRRPPRGPRRRPPRRRPPGSCRAGGGAVRTRTASPRC